MDVLLKARKDPDEALKLIRMNMCPLDANFDTNEAMPHERMCDQCARKFWVVIHLLTSVELELVMDG